MSDILDDLRVVATDDHETSAMRRFCQRAVDEIERLRQENAALARAIKLYQDERRK